MDSGPTDNIHLTTTEGNGRPGSHRSEPSAQTEGAVLALPRMPKPEAASLSTVSSNTCPSAALSPLKSDPGEGSRPQGEIRLGEFLSPPGQAHDDRESLIGKKAWDRRIEEDVAAGRLESPAEEALDDLRQGRCTDRYGIAPTRDSGVVTTLFRPKFGNGRTRLINGGNRTPGIPRSNSRKWAVSVGASGAARSNPRRGTRVGHRVVLDWAAC